MMLKLSSIFSLFVFCLFLAESANAQQIQWSTLKTVNEAPLGQYAYVQAKIRSMDPPDDGSTQPWKLYLEDNTDRAVMIVFQDTMNQYQEAVAAQNQINRENNQMPVPKLEPGIIIQVYGKIQEYKGVRQFVAEGHKWFRIAPNVMQIPDSARGISTDTNNPIPTTLGGLNFSVIGKTVLIRGIVTEYIPHDPTKSNYPGQIFVADQTGNVRVVFWTEVREGLEATGLEPTAGSAVEIIGEVSEYKGELQIKLNNPDQIRIMKGEANPT